MEETLEKIGLSKGEAKAYLNLLKLGEAKVSEIARKSELKREACYYTLKLLLEKGFVAEVIKSGVKYYAAVSPKRIPQIIQEKTQQELEAVEEIIPELESYQKIALSRSKIEVYEGSGGFRSIVSKLLEKEKQEILVYVPKKTLEYLPIFHLQFRRRRKEKQIKVRMITEESQEMRELQKKDRKELRIIRFNPLIKNQKSAYFISSEAIMIVKANEREQIGVYIQDKDIIEMQKSIFEEIWKKSRN